MTGRAMWLWPISFALAVMAFFGIPNFWNVVSNLPFAIVGILGLRKFRSPGDRILSLGVLLTAFGSAYYHLAPSDSRLVWDRLPMTVIFMAFVACANAEQRDVEPSPWIMGVLIVVGAGTVLWWRVTGDLRPYAVVKFGPILYLVPALLWSERRKYLWSIVRLFGLAQALELADEGVYSWFLVSGHTLKHLAAGLATLVVYRWRLRLAPPNKTPTTEKRSSAPRLVSDAT
jgi:hypothetical protein